MSLRDDLIAGRKVWGWAYNHPLIQEVPEDLSGADSRNLRFALTALMRIEAEVHNYTAQFPKHRLAVIIGTSTSGVADNEPVSKSMFSEKNITRCLA